MRAEAVVRAERIAHLGQRQVQVFAQHLRVRHPLGHLAQTVHVIAEGDQTRAPMIPGQGAESVAHHGRARDLAERAHVRQTRRTVTRLQNHRGVQRLKGRQGLVRLACVDQQFRRIALRVRQPFLEHVGQQVARLLKRPRTGLTGQGFKVLKHQRALKP
ncbi:hypothetical protein D3C72_1782630 [compost metagenome]